MTTITDLTTALADCSSAPNTIVIGADIVAAATELQVPCDTTIDLTTHDLTLLSIAIGTGVELTITGPSDGTEGLLTTNASGSLTQAGILTTGATLRVAGGAILATGGIYGGGIGAGGIGQSAGELIVEGGTVTAVSGAVYGSAIGGANGGGNPGGDGGVVTVTGGSVFASTTSPYGVAIGGGAGTPGGRGADITVTGGVLTASGTGSGASTLGGGDAYGVSTGGAGSLTIGAEGAVVLSSGVGSGSTVFGPGLSSFNVAQGAPGTVVVDGDLRIPSGILRMPSGTSITVGATGRILGSELTPTVGASFVGPATITNNGVIALAPAAELVTGNSRTLTYSDATPSTTVFGPTLDAGFRALADPPTGTAWNTSPDGTGTWFTGATDTSGSGTTPLFAAGAGSVAVSAEPADLTATAGEPFTPPVTVLDSLGDPVSPQPAVTFASSDCPFTGDAVFETAGVCTITATSTWGPFSPATEFDITVVAADADSLEITPSATSVAEGGSLSFTVTGEDEFGNAVDTRGVVLTSSVPTDVVDGLSVTFPTASPHTITATLGAVSASVTIDVVPVVAPVEQPPVSNGTEPDALASTGSALGASAPALAGLAALALLSGTLMVFGRRRHI